MCSWLHTKNQERHAGKEETGHCRVGRPDPGHEGWEQEQQEQQEQQVGHFLGRAPHSRWVSWSGGALFIRGRGVLGHWPGPVTSAGVLLGGWRWWFGENSGQEEMDIT